jgi:hypothetical protein
MIARLILACVQENEDAINRSMLAIKIPAGSNLDTGFTPSDLNYHYNFTGSKAAELEGVFTSKVGTLEWMRNKHEQLSEKVQRLHKKVQAVGGTIPRAEFSVILAEYHQARSECDTLGEKVEGLAGVLSDISVKACALRRAEGLIRSVVDSRRVVKTSPLYTPVSKVEV